jgi:GNAT superfamily N-acetyltransferase
VQPVGDPGKAGRGSRVGGLEIGPCRSGDLPQLFGLALGTFAAEPGWSDRRVVETLIRDVVFVARQSERPVGFVAIGQDEEGATIVEQLLVAPGHERRGIGRRLLAAAEWYAGATGATALRISVEKSDWAARSFYLRSGFVPVEGERLELSLPRR